MRKLLALLSLIIIPMMATAQPLPIVTIEGNITQDMRFTNDTIWLLKGFVIATNGATLTIDPGTIIFGDTESQGTLVIGRGARIMAEGTPTQPIVFTSEEAPGNREPGDWGGVVILGYAPVNTNDGEFYVEGIPPSPLTLSGGNNPDDNSGVLRYVRIEFAGEELTANNELNGLTMAGVGRGTTIEYVQVSYVDDDAFEWFGGTVDGRYLISLGNIDDDFDGDLGWQGRVQFGLIVRDPEAADAASGGHSNAFEQDNAPNEATGANATPRSSPVFSNVTVIGPIGQSANYHPHYQNGMRLRTGTSIGIFNSIVMGFPGLLRLDGPTSWNLAQSNELHVQNVIGTGNFINGSGDVTAAMAEAWFKTASFNNMHVASPSDVMLENPFFYALSDVSTFDPRPMANSPAANGASFTSARLPHGEHDFFVATSYVGAFEPGGERWDYPWANYDPQNTDYSQGITVSNERAYELPNGTQLMQNYPNPFNPTTRIEYTLANTQNVRMTVHDVLGREVAVLVDGAMPAGVHSATFDATGLTSGVYIYRIQTERGVSSRTMTLIK
jgi:hypothetical protein